jgi:hypothetical protein
MLQISFEELKQVLRDVMTFAVEKNCAIRRWIAPGVRQRCIVVVRCLQVQQIDWLQNTIWLRRMRVAPDLSEETDVPVWRS